MPPELHRRQKVHIPLFLLLATVISTLFAGAFISGRGIEEIIESPHLLMEGIPFSLSIIVILGTHEMGHYLTARKFGIDVSLPYFIPFPNPMIGTMGAVIRIRSPITERRAMLLLGASGPIAGMIVTLPILIYGLSTSKVEAVMPNSLVEGNSILYLLLKLIIIGPVPEGFDVMINQYAYAGWLGILVTSLNLIPVAQLDGGHILFALSPGIHRVTTKYGPLLLFVMGLFMWQGWLVWAILLILIGRFRHPFPLYQDLRRGDVFIGIVALLLFILTFIPVPFRVAS